MYHILIVIFLFSFSSCSKFRAKRNKDLVDTFELDRKKFEKFKNQEAENVIVVYKKDNKKKNNKKTRKKLITKKEVQERPEVIILDKGRPVVVEKESFSYPKDYPKDYIEYDKSSEKVWKKFSPFFFPNEIFEIDISFLGVTAGRVTLRTLPIAKVGDTPTFKFKATMRSAKFYEYIYRIDDSIESYIEVDSFLPVKYTLVQDETNQQVNDLQLFDRNTLKTHFWYKRIKKGKKKEIEKSVYTPRYFQDSFAALYFVRGLPLKMGDSYEFPIVTRAKMWLLKMKVERVEEIKANGKWQDAIRIKAETRFPGVLKKKGDIIFWYSNDKERRLLKFEAKIKIGSVTGILKRYSPGKRLE